MMNMVNKVKKRIAELSHTITKVLRRQGSNSESLVVTRKDRRTLSKVPDPIQIRSHYDRRGNDDFSVRYIGSFEVLAKSKDKKNKHKLIGNSIDISGTGILVSFPAEANNYSSFNIEDNFMLTFHITPGTMPEGYENFVRLKAKVVRINKEKLATKGTVEVAFIFEKPLPEHFKRRKWGLSIYWASSMLLIASLFVILMRAESIIYFKYNSVLYLYSIIAASFLLSRYLFGSLHRDVKVNPNFTPSVSIIIPCFNEEEWIHRTILSCINQDYPIDKLEVIVVDDCSTDGSVSRMQETIDRIYLEADRYQTKDRLKLHVMPQNGGKREALVAGVRMAKHELVVFVDSDSFLDHRAIRNIVQPFKDPKMGGVAGRTDVENKYTNSLTKLQTVRYYIAFRIMKAAESYFDSVTCLSGPLSCYRKELIVKYSDEWLNQTFLGHPATFGDDRAMTNFILRHHRTGYQDSAVCSTIVPSKMKVFLKQQMRWKRSWLRESLLAGSFIWRKEPFMALFFYIGFIVPIAAPIIVIYNLMYVPLVHGIFPTVFLLGLALMALLMSFAHLLFKRSSLWIFGFLFCLFYEFVLLWQMPIAWFTFYKSTWGTRDTPQDIEARQKRSARKAFIHNKESHKM